MKGVSPRPGPCGLSQSTDPVPVPHSLCLIEPQIPLSTDWGHPSRSPNLPPLLGVNVPGSFSRPAHQPSPGIGSGAPSRQGLEPRLGVAKELATNLFKNGDLAETGLAQ